MLSTALMWACFLLVSALALGCAVSIVLMVIGALDSIGENLEMCVLFCIFVIVLVVLGTAFTFAAIALGRNLLL